MTLRGITRVKLAISLKRLPLPFIIPELAELAELWKIKPEYIARIVLPVRCIVTENNV